VLTAGKRKANNGRVAMRFFAREWERTCAECGYTWRVPRSIARRGIRGMSGAERGMVRGGRRNLHGFSDFTAVIQARADQMEAFRICAKCGADDFTQRPAPR